MSNRLDPKPETNMPHRLDSRSADFHQRFAAFLAGKREAASDIEAATRAIVDDVAARGDKALLEATRKLDPLVLAAAEIGGVSEIYRVGGAQAIAALAYGTATIAPVSKIVVPGNAYVAAAKRLVFGTVGIDMIAGPSEVLVIADATANAGWIAADLLAQAEHDVNAQSILITDSSALADEVERAVQSQLATLPRAQIAHSSVKHYGGIIVVTSVDDAV